MTSPLLNADSITARRLKYLEIIQAIIARMANNSFMIKAWNLTLVSAIITFSEKVHTLVTAALIPAIIFWLLDAYYLSQERRFRKLWDAQCAQAEDAATDFSLDTTAFPSSWGNAFLSKTLLIFHGGLLFLIALVSILIKN